MKVLSIHKNFLKYGKLNVVFLSDKFLDFLIWPLLSILELITGKRKNLQTFVLEFLSHFV